MTSARRTVRYRKCLQKVWPGPVCVRDEEQIPSNMNPHFLSRETIDEANLPGMQRVTLETPMSAQAIISWRRKVRSASVSALPGPAANASTRTWLVFSGTHTETHFTVPSSSNTLQRTSLEGPAEAMLARCWRTVWSSLIQGPSISVTAETSVLRACRNIIFMVVLALDQESVS